MCLPQCTYLKNAPALKRYSSPYYKDRSDLESRPQHARQRPRTWPSRPRT